LSVLDNVLIALRNGRLGHLLSRNSDDDAVRTAEDLLAFVGYRGPLANVDLTGLESDADAPDGTAFFAALDDLLADYPELIAEPRFQALADEVGIPWRESEVWAQMSD